MVGYWKLYGDEPSSINRIDNDQTYLSDNIEIIPQRLNSSLTRAKALTAEQAAEVRRLRKQGEQISKLAVEFRTSARCISNVRKARFYTVEERLNEI
jgi:hypothetical protein